MYYYLVWVRSSRYHGDDPLTYTSDDKLNIGNVVLVELQNQMVIGFVSGVTSKPRFKTKPISQALDIPALPQHLIKLAAWLKTYYPAPIGIITQQLLPASLSDKRITSKSQLNFDEAKKDQLPKLTSQQNSALADMAEQDTYILHGITGSGKTRIYIELVEKSLAGGKSAIVLTPEISLTTQLADSFKSVFGQRVIIMHSQQTPVERQTAWLESLRAEQPVIIVGPRSALFSPVQNLGLIILDEAHESAYKQEQAPQYQTGRVAAYLASMSRSSLILGSATPAISDYYLAEQKKKPIIELTKLATDKKTSKSADSARYKVKVDIIDKKDHSLFSRSPTFSNSLLKAIEVALGKGEQTLLYLNRRGTARLVMCENCGWQATCPHCDLPLTYHGDHHQLRCHSCSYHTSSPSSCPACKHPTIMFKTAGTKAVVEEIERLFPQAKIARFDTDNTKAERFEKHYEDIRNGKVDILVGTQLLAKGLDLPKLSTLGIILADTSLYMPDFSAHERTFQLLNQVLGRIGRGHVAGHAVIQTYRPEHPALTTAINSDYKTFYEAELASRKQFLFPPFCYLLKISVRRASISSAQAAAEKIKEDIQQNGYHVRVEGPAPSFYERFQNKYQWQLVAKATQRSELIKIIDSLPANCSYDIDPMDLL